MLTNHICAQHQKEGYESKNENTMEKKRRKTAKRKKKVEEGKEKKKGISLLLLFFSPFSTRRWSISNYDRGGWRHEHVVKKNWCVDEKEKKKKKRKVDEARSA